MYKIPLTYEDPFEEDEPKTEIAYFHLTMVECMELEDSVPGGLAKKFGNLGQDSMREIMEFFRILIRASYGVKENGRFVKHPDLTDAFMSGPAFEVLFFRLFTDPKMNKDFITQVMPKGLFTPDGNVKSESEIIELVRSRGIPSTTPAGQETNSLQVPPTEPEKPAEWLPWADREPTDAELMSMTPEQLRDVYRRRSQGWAPAS